MKKWFKKTVAVILAATMAMTVGGPAFAGVYESNLDENKTEQINVTLQPGDTYTQDLGNGLTMIHSLEIENHSSATYSTLKNGEAHYYIQVQQNSVTVGRAHLNVWYSYGDNRVYITEVKPILTRYSDVEGTVLEHSVDYSVSGNGAKTAEVIGEYYLKREYPNGTTVVSKPNVTITFTCNEDTIDVSSKAVED